MYTKTLIIAALFMVLCFHSVGYISGEENLLINSTYPVIKTETYFVLRDNLSNSRIRFSCDKKGCVAFLGGSITNMTGWRQMVCELLQKTFPETQFDFVNAGIPSTDTSLGPFRLQRDVFSRGRVDLLFVEFAVNDQGNGRSTKESIRGMEGIIRQARQTNPYIDIIMLHFVDPEKMRLINEGKMPPVIVSYEQVARHYCIPSINLAKEVTERIKAGEFDWETFGGLHPAPFGHRIYTRSIERLLSAAWNSSLPVNMKTLPYPMPSEPIDPLHYGSGRFIDVSQAYIVNGWQYIRSWNTDKGRTRPRFINIPMLAAEEPGAVLKLKFNGTAVGIHVVAGPDVGVIEYGIDGKPAKQVDQFTRWSSGLNIPWVYMLDADLKPGSHRLTLRTTNKKNPDSQGYAARIVKFVVN